MNAFVALRYVTFALILLFAVLTGSFSALNLGYLVSGYVTKPSTVAEGLATFLVALSLMTVLFLLTVIAIELCRKGAITSRIWFELIWAFVFFMAYLGGAIAATILIPGAICHTDAMSKMMCMASTGLIAFTWIIASLHLLYFCALLIYTFVRSRREFGAWSSSVIDQPTQSTSIPPVMITHTYSRSVDGPIGNVHHINFAEASQSDEHSPAEEKEKKRRAGGLVQPTFTLNPGLNGPPTFGPTGTARNMGDLESARGRSLGVNAINRAPVHRDYRFPAHPYQTGVHEPSSASSAGADQYPTKQAPWLNGEDSPSAAVIRTASKAVLAPPSVSLYPVHVVNAGLTTVPVKPNTPTAKSALTGFLQAKRQSQSNQSKTSIPYLNTSRGTSQRTMASSAGHSQSYSIDSFIQDSDGSSINTTMASTHQRNRSDESDNRPRRKRMGPRHRPPPLNLTGLSNIANAERRR